MSILLVGVGTIEIVSLVNGGDSMLIREGLRGGVGMPPEDRMVVALLLASLPLFLVLVAAVEGSTLEVEGLPAETVSMLPLP